MVADRAFLAGARMGPGLARLDGEVARILGRAAAPPGR